MKAVLDLTGTEGLVEGDYEIFRTSGHFEIKPGRDFFIEHADVPDGSLRVDHFSLKFELPQGVQNIIKVKLMSLIKTVDPDNCMQVILGMYKSDPLCLLPHSSVHSRLHSVNLKIINISNITFTCHSTLPPLLIGSALRVDSSTDHTPG